MKEIISIIVIGTKKFFDFFLRKLVAIIKDSFTSFIAGTMIQIFAIKISLFSE